MTGFYTNSDGIEIEINGTRSEWISFVQKSLHSYESVILDYSLDPDPYDQVARKIDFEITSSSAVEFRVATPQNIRFSGGEESFRRLQRFLSGFPETFDVGDHIHIDSAEDFISDNSASLVAVMLDG